VLERLVEAARFAPTGSNRQDVHIVMVTDPERLETLRARVMARYRDYERHLTSAVKRFLLSRFIDRRLGDPAVRDYLARFLSAYRDGRDPLFHGAPVVAFLHTGSEATTPKDDCCLALYHMILTAERLGLGSCFLGTVEIAFARTPSLNDLLGIPRGRPLLASACFGYPAVAFHREVDRKPAAVRWL
jgi:nitroreductase